MTTTRGFGAARNPIVDLSGVSGLVFTAEAELAPLNTFRIGGAAEFLVEVESEEALRAVLGWAHRFRVPFFLLGLGSNVLVPDEGLAGVVAKLGGVFYRVEVDGTAVRAGGAVQLSKLARSTVRKGLLGLEALAGFPSTVGGAVRMNAGSYGTEICDLLKSVRAVDRGGGVVDLTVDDLGAGYRTTLLQESGHIVVDALFELERGDGDAASARIAELSRRRWESLPAGNPNVGSIFRNPAAESAGRLIDECGLKGSRAGGAQISPKHGNVIVNTGAARADDVLELMARAHEAVVDRFAISLEPEVVLAGTLGGKWREMTAAARERVEKSIAG
jgi:UDP-N-acetylmuramate dehydrogenase